MTELRLEIERNLLPLFLDEMDEFLEKYQLPKLIEEMENLHNSLFKILFKIDSII